MNEDNTTGTETSNETPRTLFTPRQIELVMIGLAVLGAFCVLPIVSGLLLVIVKIAIGLLGAALGLLAGLVSLGIGLVIGAAGLVIGLLAAALSFAVSPPGLCLIALVIYLKHRD